MSLFSFMAFRWIKYISVSLQHLYSIWSLLNDFLIFLIFYFFLVFYSFLIYDLGKKYIRESSSKSSLPTSPFLKLGVIVIFLLLLTDYWIYILHSWQSLILLNIPHSRIAKHFSSRKIMTTEILLEWRSDQELKMFIYNIPKRNLYIIRT